MDAPTVAAVQSTIRRRILRLFVRRALLDADDAKDMRAWQHDGGFSLDASVRIEGHDRPGLERLLRYCARPPLALERIERVDERILYHLPRPTPDGQTRLTLTPLEFISRLAALIPAPRLHRHRYDGVLAPNARLRPAVTAMVCEARASGNASVPSSAKDDKETGSRSPARYLGRRCCWPDSTRCFRFSAPRAGHRCGSSRSSPIPRQSAKSWTTSVSLPHRHRSPPPVLPPAWTARRRPRRIRACVSLRSIRSPITTTIKAFHGDRGFLRPETVTVPAAPVAPATHGPPVESAFFLPSDLCSMADSTLWS